MSSSDGTPSERLSDALDEIFSSGKPSGRSPRSAASERAGATDRHTVGDEDTDQIPAEPYELPQIIPATTDAPVEPEPSPAAPSLPAAGPAARPARAQPPEAHDRPSQAAPSQAAPAAIRRAPTDPTTSSASAGTSRWTDQMASVPVAGGSLRTPGRRPRVRRVTRVLRHIDPWSTFKVGLLFSLVTYVVLLTSGVLLWRVADSTGTLDNVERWFTQFGWETFELKGGEIFHNAWIIGLFLAVGTTGGLVLLATLFNLVSDIIGGIRVTVLEEEVVERTVTSTRRYVVRQGPATAGPAAPPPQDWDIEDDGDAVDGDELRPAPPASTAEPVDVPSADWSVDD